MDEILIIQTFLSNNPVTIIFRILSFCFLPLFLLSAYSQDSLPLLVVVSADKMNVLYIGVDNPVSIAVPGIPAEKVSATITNNGTLKQISPLKYVANVTIVDFKGQTKIQVYAEMRDGSKKMMGEVAFRVKRLPDPVAMIGPYKGGDVKASIFKVQRGIIAVLENFDFDVRFNVVGFEMTYVSAENEAVTLSAEGPLFTEDMIDVLAKSKPGDKFIFDKIKVRGPDSSIRLLQPTVFYLI